jgi:hypothetical protein
MKILNKTPYWPSLCVMLLCGCVSLMEKTGQVLDGSAFAEKTVFVYRTPKRAARNSGETIEVRETRSKDGEWSLCVILKKFPMMQLRGSAPDAKGNFQLTSLDYLGSSIAGWNEYSLEILGAGTLMPEEDAISFTIPESPEAIQISRGRIHRYDTRLTGEEALTSLRNRRERILSLTEWMGSQENAPRGLDLKSFEKYWKPILLPEMTGGGKRPAGWKQKGDQWVMAEDIRWNTGYTGRVFPEELWAVRNSGTLLRDWEEASGWIYLEYEWERIAELLAREHTLEQIK